MRNRPSCSPYPRPTLCHCLLLPSSPHPLSSPGALSATSAAQRGLPRTRPARRRRCSHPSVSQPPSPTTRSLVALRLAPHRLTPLLPAPRPQLTRIAAEPRTGKRPARESPSGPAHGPPCPLTGGRAGAEGREPRACSAATGKSPVTGRAAARARHRRAAPGEYRPDTPAGGSPARMPGHAPAGRAW